MSCFILLYKLISCVYISSTCTCKYRRLLCWIVVIVLWKCYALYIPDVLWMFWFACLYAYISYIYIYIYIYIISFWVFFAFFDLHVCMLIYHIYIYIFFSVGLFLALLRLYWISINKDKNKDNWLVWIKCFLYHPAACMCKLLNSCVQFRSLYTRTTFKIKFGVLLLLLKN